MTIRLSGRVAGHVVLLLLFLSAGNASAESFRCGSYLAREDMTAAEIEEKCGKPDLIRRIEVPVYVTRANGLTFVNGVETELAWFYERSPYQFVARLLIRDGKVREITLLRELRLEQIEFD